MFQKFPDVENFHTLRKYLPRLPEFKPNDTVVYQGKIKLHGTNAGVIITPNGEVRAQSRKQLIDSTCDNAGFAAWLETRKDFFAGLEPSVQNTYVFGEWCGQGIQSGTAVNDIGKKVFAIFAIQFGNSDDPETQVMVEPDMIETYLDDYPDDVYVLPWQTDPLSMSFQDTERLNSFIDNLNEVVQDVEKCDPWVLKTFDVCGIGEGIVLYPVTFTDKWGCIRRDVMSGLMFKAKGQKHSVNKTKKPVEADPEQVKSAQEFADKFVTEARCEQIAQEISRGDEPDYIHKMIGPFIGALSKDVKKESKAELEVSGLDWKFANKFVTEKARNWFLEKIEKSS